MIEATFSDAVVFAAGGGPTPIDRAVDSLTVTSIEVQRLRRRTLAGRPVDREQLEAIDRIEAQLRKLELALAALRA
jgi:hypothetical protein